MTTSKVTNLSFASLDIFQVLKKRVFDFFLSAIGIFIFWWLILLAWIFASIETRSNGFFIQKRVGRSGKIFHIVKIKTMRPVKSMDSTVTVSGDSRITRLGGWFRKTKIDELPQLWNVLIGDMSFVGPRPDVPSFADKLRGDERAILTIRPGITGPATLKYRNEEDLLASKDDPESYNRNVIWPDKVQINLDYIREWSISRDIYYIIKTVYH